MIDNDRLIKAWKMFRDSNPYEICDGIEFVAIKEPEYRLGQMIEDTITLLKEQEAEISFLKGMQLKTIHNMSEGDIGDAVAKVLRLKGW